MSLDSNAIPAFDFNRLAGPFERFLPLIQPVGEAVLGHLPSLVDGSTVLDVACGSGEPGLTLARRAPGLRVLGVDRAEQMIAVARARASRDGLTNARFDVATNESFAEATGPVDAIISRFGLLMFGDVPASAKELSRALRPGAPYSLAVWDEARENTLMHAALSQVKALRPAQVSPADVFARWAEPGVRQRLLAEGGVAEVHSAMFRWHYHFEGFDALWSLLDTMAGITGHDVLEGDARRAFRDGLRDALGAYLASDGGYVIPHACRLFWGRR